MESNVLNLTPSITAFGTAMTQLINTNAPALFAILAVAIGFFFIWSRVRGIF